LRRVSGGRRVRRGATERAEVYVEQVWLKEVSEETAWREG
jgi:hypothetical protein